MVAEALWIDLSSLLLNKMLGTLHKFEICVSSIIVQLHDYCYFCI